MSNNEQSREDMTQISVYVPEHFDKELHDRKWSEGLPKTEQVRRAIADFYSLDYTPLEGKDNE